VSATPRPRSGFSLIEVLVALVVLEVGLVGCAGTLVLAQRQMAAAERLHRATQAAAAAADSLLARDAVGSGESSGSWGRVTWSPADGGVLVRAEDPARAPLLEWWIPLGGTR
jgi:prepilin-type N-terminal cleavage/methylation domain-containing protein